MAIFPVGVVVHVKEDPLEEVLAAACRRIGALAGVRLGGLVPRHGRQHLNGRLSMWLDDIIRGDSIALSQELGAGAASCILNPDGLAQARVRLAQAVAARPDIVFFGRFAKEELAGRGIREEIGLAVGDGIPALVAVDESMLPGWIEFAGDEWTRLSVSVDAIVAWFTAIMAARQTELERA
ncbi:MAG: DUF2478 domain-containing protein [Alphaproteobacteria bacterium]|nr:DUF2478 domain-containing protein [Alphaproteobacteria bacterium]